MWFCEIRLHFPVFVDLVVMKKNDVVMAITATIIVNWIIGKVGVAITATVIVNWIIGEVGVAITATVIVNWIIGEVGVVITATIIVNWIIGEVGAGGEDLLQTPVREQLLGKEVGKASVSVTDPCNSGGRG